MIQPTQFYQTIQGVAVPALGFGTWPLKDAACRASVADALQLGYRHIDTARMYGNEQAVGQGIKMSGVPREAIFLTTKLWHTELSAPKVREGLHDSLRNLQTEYVDLLLIHWPNKRVPVGETLAAMQRLQAEAKVKHIGVSNFTPDLLQEALGHAPVFCNQVEYHPFLSQAPLLELCRRHDVLLTAYSPVAHGKVNDHPLLTEIGQRYGKTAIQLTLRWLTGQEKVAAIPKASRTEHRQANFAIFDFELTPEEIQQIAGLAHPSGRLINPAWAPDWP